MLKPLDNTYSGAMARGAEAAAKDFSVGLTTVALIGGLPADPGSLARMKGFSNAVEGPRCHVGSRAGHHGRADRCARRPGDTKVETLIRDLLTRGIGIIIIRQSTTISRFAQCSRRTTM